MTKDEALTIVLEALENLNLEFEPADRVEVSPKTRLFGSDAVIDSLSLVSVIVDVEQAVADRVGAAVSLTDDRAINQDVSPFTTPDTLADYIATIANEP
jgi:acyl carrier protein